MILIPVRCRGCMRQVGVATDVHNAVYCDEACAEFEPASAMAARDDVVVLLDRLGVNRDVLAAEFDITKQRVSQIVSRSA